MTETQRAALAGKRGRTSSAATSVHSDEEETRARGTRAPATQLVLSPNRFDALADLADAEVADCGTVQATPASTQRLTTILDSRITVAPPSPATAMLTPPSPVAAVMAPLVPAAAVQALTSPDTAVLVPPAPAPVTATAPTNE